VRIQNIRPRTFLVLFLGLAVAACGGGSSGGGGGGKKLKGFRVTEVDPRDGQNYVALDAPVTVTFSSPVKGDSVHSGSFLVRERASLDRLSGRITVAENGRSATFTPDNLYLLRTGYRVTVKTEVQSVLDESLVQEFTSTFTSALTNENPPPPPPPAPKGKMRPAGDLQVGRSSHTSTLLGSGGVLIAGGFSISNAVTNALEIYDPDSETFSFASQNMRKSRGFHAATRLDDGRVLLTGGVTGTNFVETNTAELFDPANGSTVYTSSTMVSPRAFHTSTRLPDGRVLILGGTVPGATGSFSSKLAEIYDPVLDSFTSLPRMAAFRAGHTATSLEDGRVLILGGNGSDVTVEIFDPSTDTFSTLDSTLISPRRGHTATRLPSGDVVIVGGGDRGGEIYVAEKGWIQKTPGILLVARKDHTASLTPDGRVLLTGGSYQQGSQLIFNRTTELYDPTSGAFIGSSPLLEQPKTRHRATTLVDGEILLTGGMNLDPSLPDLDSAEIYYQDD